MGRAFYRFGHEIALRVPNGQAFALHNAELGAFFEHGDLTQCFLRGTLTATSFRGLSARGLIPPNPELLALAQPVAVRLNLKPEWVPKVGKDVLSLNQIGRRMDVNNLTDEVARKMLMFESWHLGSATTLGQKAQIPLAEGEPHRRDPKDEARFTAIITEFGGELVRSAQEAAIAAQPPPPEKPIAIEEAIALFFEEEEWEALEEQEGLLRSTFDGQNGSWMCYTQILQEFDQVLFYSVCPVSVPTFAIAAMTEFVCRVNADLSLGNFEIDFDHNIVRFRTSLDVTGVGLAPYLFRNVVFQNLAAMDLYLPALMGIIAGKSSE